MEQIHHQKYTLCEKSIFHHCIVNISAEIIFRPAAGASVKAGSKISSIEGYVKTSTSKITIQGTYETKIMTDGTTTCVFHCKREVTKMFAKVTISYTKSN